MSIVDHIDMAAPSIYQAGPLKVLVHRASSQALQTETGDLIIQRVARERWIRDTGIHFGEVRATVLMYVYRGHCRLEHGPVNKEQVATVGAAQIIAVPPNCRYRFWVEPKEDLELAIAHSSGAVFDRWWQALGGARPSVLIVRRRREIERDLEDVLQHAPSWLFTTASLPCTTSRRS